MEFVSRALIAGSFCGGQVCYEAKAEENMAIHKQQVVTTSLVETKHDRKPNKGRKTGV